MEYENTRVSACLNECKALLTDKKLPSWDELPEIDLYMDQVIELVNKYLAAMEIFSGDGSEITRPMINNYVKLKMMPAPVKKKYSRTHLAYIIVICTLKQSLNMATIQKILPAEIPEEEAENIYNSFVRNQQTSFSYAAKQAEAFAEPVLEAENADPHIVDDLIMQIAFSANIFKRLTEKVVDFSADVLE